MSLRSVTLSARRQQEAEVVATQERERAAATTARAARLAAAKLAAARAEVEAAEAADAARATAAGAARATATELEALRGSSADSSVPATAAPTMSSGWQGRQRKSRRLNGQPRTPMGIRAAAA
jgi:hypothetical protein